MNYYELLQVREDASDEVIKMAYKALAKKYHPDTYEGDKSYAEAKMKEINAAYSVLSDAVKRAEYDIFLQQKASKDKNNDKAEHHNSVKTKKGFAPKLKWIVIAVIIIVSVPAIILSLRNNDVEKVKDSVVMIKVYDEDENEIATGSGFCAFESDYIVTNFHVIEGASKITIVTDDEKQHIINNILIFNEEQDLAILKGSFNLTPIKISDGYDLKAGDKITAIGSPEGVLNTVSTGVISNADNEYQIRITAPISPGSSGGVLLDSKNKVVGITYATYDSNTAQNLNFAINVKYLKYMYGCLLDNNYTSLNETNIEEYFEHQDSFEYWSNEKFSNYELDESVYFSIGAEGVWKKISAPYAKFEYDLEESNFDWLEVYRDFSNSEKELTVECYEELLSMDFDNSNVAGSVSSWNAAEFFINLNILDKTEYAIASVAIADFEDDVWDQIDDLPVEYEVKLLLADLRGDYEWEYYSDEEKEMIFKFFDGYYWEDISDMGEVLEYLGYDVQYENDGTLTAYW